MQTYIYQLNKDPRIHQCSFPPLCLCEDRESVLYQMHVFKVAIAFVSQLQGKQINLVLTTELYYSHCEVFHEITLMHS